jgi:hypothetical protein
METVMAQFRVYFSTLGEHNLSFGHWLLKKIISCCTGSRLVHVAIGNEKVVLSVSLGGISYWPKASYEWAFPGVTHYVDLEGDPVDFEMFKSGVGQPRQYWPTLWRWLRRGQTSLTADCLCTTAVVLWCAGVAIPPDIVSPAQLLEWFKAHGYTVQTHRPRLPLGCRGADSAAG